MRRRAVLAGLAGLAVPGREARGALAASGPPGSSVGVFVHGYNNKAAEAVCRHAQMARDFGEAGPQITFAWPSAARPLGYVADRDAALRSRRYLDDLLTLLMRRQRRPVVLIGHSMGGFLVVETLQRMALRGTDVHRGLAGVVLVSPDIDVDLFVEQAAAIGPLPRPFIVTISDRDWVLGLSARLAGRRPRLGAPDEPTRLRSPDITVIDLSNAEGGQRGGHLQAVSSPDALRWLDPIEPSTSRPDGREDRPPHRSPGFRRSRRILPGHSLHPSRKLMP